MSSMIWVVPSHNLGLFLMFWTSSSSTSSIVTNLHQDLAGSTLVESVSNLQGCFPCSHFLFLFRGFASALPSPSGQAVLANGFGIFYILCHLASQGLSNVIFM